MKNYKKDIIINFDYSPKLIYQLHDNKIFIIVAILQQKIMVRQ